MGAGGPAGGGAAAAPRGVGWRAGDAGGGAFSRSCPAAALRTRAVAPAGGGSPAAAHGRDAAADPGRARRSGPGCVGALRASRWAWALWAVGGPLLLLALAALAAVVGFIARG